jgi:hypothetical protein
LKAATTVDPKEPSGQTRMKGAAAELVLLSEGADFSASTSVFRHGHNATVILSPLQLDLRASFARLPFSNRNRLVDWHVDSRGSTSSLRVYPVTSTLA